MEHDKDTSPKKSTTNGQGIDLSDTSSTLANGVNRQVAHTEQVLKDFKAEVASSPGFRAGSARAPGQYMSAVEVTSWLQVPAILNQLQNEGVEKLRIIFPTPTAGSFVAPEHIAAFIKEQHQISNFIKENHAKPIEEIKKLLVEKIENSLSFGVLKSRPDEGDSVTASAWVDASLLSSEDSRSLSVSTLFPIGRKSISKETTTDPLTLSLLESAVNDRPSTVTIPGTNPQKLKELAQLFHSLLQDGGRLHDHSDALMSKTKVWVGPYNSELNTNMKVRQQCNDVKEFSLREFIDTYLPKDQGPSLSSEASTPPHDAPPVEAPLAAGVEAHDVRSAPSEHDTPPAFDAPVSTEQEERDDIPPLLDTESTQGVEKTSSASAHESNGPLPPPDNAQDVTDPASNLEASSPDELILHAERRLDARAPTDSPLAEVSLPPRPDEIDPIEPIEPVDPVDQIVTIDLARYAGRSEENAEEAIEIARRKRNSRLSETTVVETPKLKPELEEEKPRDGGFV